MQGDETSSENVGCCQREGCQNPAACNCKGCGEAHYCSMGHAMEDWKNHVIDCNLNISQLPDDTLFVTEFNAKTQEGGPAEWTPVDMIHMRATPDGGFTQMTFNEDASAKIAEQDNLAVEAVTPVESAVFAGEKKETGFCQSLLTLSLYVSQARPCFLDLASIRFLEARSARKAWPQ